MILLNLKKLILKKKKNKIEINNDKKEGNDSKNNTDKINVTK